MNQLARRTWFPSAWAGWMKTTLLAQPWEQRHARRLVKRLRRHSGELSTFLDRPEVPFDNNHDERQTRPAPIARKISYANGSDDGAEI